MYIESKTTYKYPVHTVRQWIKGTYQPLADHKYTIVLNDGNIIQAGVFEIIQHDVREIHACVSSQVGCKFGCLMCSTAKMGFVRNITSEEILRQIELLAHQTAIEYFDRVMFMGMGEPLDNYANIIQSVRTTIQYQPANANKFSFATIGIPHKLRMLIAEGDNLFKSVWISLHAATDEKRTMLIPANRIYPIVNVLTEAKSLAIETATTVWINYMLYPGFNDSAADVNVLSSLLHGTEDIYKVMITMPNASFSRYCPASEDDLFCFEQRLRACGVANSIGRFIAAGQSIKAGCGEFIYPFK